MKRFSTLFQPANYLFIITAWALGSGIARYLGASIRWSAFLLGLTIILLVYSAAVILEEYFCLHVEPIANGESYRERERNRGRFLQSGYAILAASILLIIAILLTDALTNLTGLLFLLAYILMFAYAVPPIHLFRRGYGEPVLAILLCTLTPAVSYLLQEPNLHRLVPLTGFPLTLLGIAYFLAENFLSYASDVKNGRQSMLIRLTWQRAIPVHHILILAAFLLILLSTFFGISWGVVWPVMLALPFFVLQILWLQRIANGGKPLWRFFGVLIKAAFGLVLYLSMLPYWIR